MAVMAAGSAAHTGEQQAKSQRRGIRAQKAAQESAIAKAVGERKLGDMEEAKLNKRKPDISTLLGRERKLKGPASTMLTGPGGASKGLLGGKSMLGGLY
tara:strand:- start:101 stop:397 length:297 start_codon:yes stop_codon:yes gene_type:complete